MPIFSCCGKRPSNLGVFNGQLAPCPSSANCLCSDATDRRHQIEALALFASPENAWPIIQETVASLPRTTIITKTDDYLHAQCASAIFGFIDDLELHLRTATGSVAVRSASRLGRSDFGVNRRRIEKIRATLRQQGIVR